MDFFGKDPIGQCERCSEEIYSEDYIYNEKVLCPVCREYVERDIAIVDFAKSYPSTLFEYLRECGVVSGDEKILEVLRDFREWVQEDFDRWVVS